MDKVAALQIPTFEAEAPGYDEDFVAWLEEQGRRLRQLSVPGLDTPNIAEEIEGLARDDRRQIARHLRVLLSHMLKWRYQPSVADRAWRLTILIQRHQLASLLDDSPSLRQSIGEAIAQAYPRAASRAAMETGLFEEMFPPVCEWSSDEVLEQDFLPAPVE